MIYGLMSHMTYEDCSKSIRRDFFPRKLMNWVRCAVEGRWRVPSCAYVDFFPQQTASVACNQRVSESVYAARVTFCENDGTTRAAVLQQTLPEAWR